MKFNIKNDAKNIIGSICVLIIILYLTNKVWVKFLKQLCDITDYHQQFSVVIQNLRESIVIISQNQENKIEFVNDMFLI